MSAHGSNNIAAGKTSAGLPIGVIIPFSPLELSCTSNQAPGCTYSQHNAHCCADCEIKGARIEQNLKCVTHSRSSGAVGIASRCGQPPCTFPSRALSAFRRNGAATFIDNLPSCTKGLRSLVSSRRTQPFLGAQNLFPRRSVRQRHVPLASCVFCRVSTQGHTQANSDQHSRKTLLLRVHARLFLQIPLRKPLCNTNS